jgi:hypothetical protein
VFSERVGALDLDVDLLHLDAIGLLRQVKRRRVRRERALPLHLVLAGLPRGSGACGGDGDGVEK